jgi:hypothetical protein
MFKNQYIHLLLLKIYFIKDALNVNKHNFKMKSGFFKITLLSILSVSFIGLALSGCNCINSIEKCLCVMDYDQCEKYYEGIRSNCTINATKINARNFVNYYEYDLDIDGWSYPLDKDVIEIYVSNSSKHYIYKINNNELNRSETVSCYWDKYNVPSLTYPCNRDSKILINYRFIILIVFVTFVIYLGLK